MTDDIFIGGGGADYGTQQHLWYTFVKLSGRCQLAD